MLGKRHNYRPSDVCNAGLEPSLRHLSSNIELIFKRTNNFCAFSEKPSRNFKTDLLSCLSSSFSQTHAFKQHFGKTSKTHMPADPFHSNYTGSVQLHNTEQFRHLAKRPARLRLNYLLLSPRALLLSCGPLGLIPYSSTFRNL